MAAIADFLSDILGGLILVALALALGGIVWSLGVLRVLRPGPLAGGAATQRAIAVIRWGAVGLGLGQILDLVFKAYVLAASMGRSPFPDFFAVDYVEAGMLRAALAFALAAATRWVDQRARAPQRWMLLAALGIAITVAGAWLSHGSSRIEDRGALMALTALHTLAGAIWVGGVGELLGLRFLVRREPALQPLWPLVVSRFAPLGIGAVVLLAISATPLGLYYVRSLSGLIGTGYGSMVAVKTVLFAAALILGAMNFRAGRQWAKGGDAGEVTRRVPHFIEVESFVLIALLLAAASLSSQPPAIDISGERASFAEVERVFAPRIPQVVSPTHAEMPTDPNNPLGISAHAQHLEDLWSDYNHNISGLVLITISLLALLARRPGFAWARHWPAGFVALAVFLFIRSDPETWPLGHVPFWQSLASAEVFQHRLAILLAACLGIVEWRARTARGPTPWYAYVFPILAAVGGVLLLTHSHSAFELKPTYLIQLSHTVMGLLAVFLACGRWLELRLEPPASRRAGLAAILSLFLIGVILTFYQEAILA